MTDIISDQMDSPSPSRAARLEKILRAAFQPSVLLIEDESARHAGHAGARAGGETHYKIRMVTQHFSNRTRVERSRMVHAVVQDEFTKQLHALSLSLHSPEEI